MAHMEAEKHPCKVTDDINLLIVVIILIGVIIMFNPKKCHSKKKAEIERAKIALFMMHRLSCLLRLS